MTYDHCIIGGGIVGLASAHALLERRPGARLLVLEKEERWASHQTGHNSGVIHSSVYNRPGSAKARFARAAHVSLVDFCRRHGIAHELCGKLVVARDAADLPSLRLCHERGLANGLRVRWLGPGEAREFEPHVRAVAALHVPEAGIVSYRQICERLAELAASAGADLRLRTRVTGLTTAAGEIRVETTAGDFSTAFLVACGGLQCDRLAHLQGLGREVRVVPFRGDYYALRPDRRHLVRNLIYPAPNPIYPFLGVHLVRMIGGQIDVGPNAVLNPSRENYDGAVDWAELAGILAFPGFHRLARRYWREGLAELWRSWNKAAFVRAAQRLVPAITAADLEPAPAGIRAQTMNRAGELVDDFVLTDGPRSLHVLNAPSPAATCALEIGRVVAERAIQRTGAR